MSTLGAGARSLRAPATPSITGLPWTGSSTPGWVTGPTTGVKVDQLWPPLVERDIISNVWPFLVATPNTYALPWLSVRIVHPSSGLIWLLPAAGLIWCWDQVSPPSEDTATCSGAGAALPFSCPLND